MYLTHLVSRPVGVLTNFAFNKPICLKMYFWPIFSTKCGKHGRNVSMLLLKTNKNGQRESKEFYRWNLNKCMVGILAEIFHSIIAQPAVSLAPTYCGSNFPVFVLKYCLHIVHIPLKEK